MSGSPGPHPGDLLSALLDGELTAGEAAAVRAHVVACDACAEDLEVTARVRSLTRRLPPVAPPPGFIEGIVAPPRRRRWGAVGAAAAAAAVAVVAAAGAPGRVVQPDVGGLVAAHAATTSVVGDPISQLAPAGVPVRFEP